MPVGWWPAGRGKLVALLVTICAVEGADIFLLGATFHALSRDLGVSPSDLGILAMAQALMITTFGPVWGVLADRRVMTRQRILTLGCLGWGMVTIALASVTLFRQMVLLRALNGAFLGCLQPVCQGIVSDVTPAAQRGRVFGLLSSSLFVGMMGTSLFVTPVSHQMLHGVAGWRVAYVAIGVISVTLAAVINRFMDDTGQLPPSATTVKTGFLLAREAEQFTSYLRFRTFGLLLVQGVFGAIPPQALTFLTMYFQLCGFSDVQAALVATMGVCGAAVGRALGGWIGDALALWAPGHGRPLAAQISVLLGAPLAYSLVGHGTPSPEDFRFCASLSFVLGLLTTWALPALDRPLLSELVRADQRVSVFGWRWMLEGSSGAVLGAPLVGLLATKVWGYKLNANAERVLAPHGPMFAADVDQAAALGNAVFSVCVVPWAVCFAVYCALHRTYGTDLETVQHENRICEKAKRAASGAGAGAGV